MSPVATSSPPSSSPLFSLNNDLPVVATNTLGMIADENSGSLTRKKQQDVKVVRKKREPRRYVSKHFIQGKPIAKRSTKKKAVKEEEGSENPSSAAELPSPKSAAVDAVLLPKVKTEQPVQVPPRIFYGLNVDELSSDSDLTDVPSDIGPDPFLAGSASEPEVAAFKVRKKSNSTKSPYFPAAIHRHRQHFLTTLPFPPLDHPTFGLMQERLAHDPFRLLIATIFLNKTPGERAMPIFFELMKQYPTPLALSQAVVADVTAIIQTLGFQNQRARKCVAMAQAWVAAPPSPDKRYRKLNYPCKGDGRDIKEGEILGREDERVAWEISHLPGLGPYSHDSWRMFCRDRLRGLSTGWLGEGVGDSDTFEPEWKRVLPTDKELRAWMTWVWLKEGWMWNKETGQRTRADEELLRLARFGGVVQESKGDEHLVVKGLGQQSLLDKKAVEIPAGDFIPGGDS